jgi:hypothetical protein
MNLPLNILLAIKRIAAALPPALLLVCGINLFSTLADLAGGPHGFGDPKLGAASGLTRTLFFFAPFPSAGLLAGLAVLAGNARAGAGPVRWWNWLLMSIGIAVLWVTRELIEWHHVPVVVADWPITRWIGSLALVAFAVAGLAMTPARRK